GPRLVLEDRRRRELRLKALARSPALPLPLREDRLRRGQHGEAQGEDGNEAYVVTRHDALPGTGGSAGLDVPGCRHAKAGGAGGQGGAGRRIGGVMGPPAAPCVARDSSFPPAPPCRRPALAPPSFSPWTWMPS